MITPRQAAAADRMAGSSSSSSSSGVPHHAPRAPAAAQARGYSRRPAAQVSCCSSSKEVTLLDYGAGNVRSVRNAIMKLGFTIKDVRRACTHTSQPHPTPPIPPSL